MGSDVIEIIILLFLSIFFLCYTFGMFHAWILDDWRPWKNGWKWWKPVESGEIKKRKTLI